MGKLTIQLGGWSPHGQVTTQHAAFLADTAANLYSQGATVHFHYSTCAERYCARNEQILKARMTGCDLIFSCDWNVWGPIGSADKTMYHAALRLMIVNACTDYSEWIEETEADIMRGLYGSIDAAIFQLPTGDEIAPLLISHDFNAPIEKIPPLIVPLQSAGMFISKPDRAADNRVGVMAPAFYQSPGTGEILAIQPTVE